MKKKVYLHLTKFLIDNEATHFPINCWDDRYEILRRRCVGQERVVKIFREAGRRIMPVAERKE